MACRQPEGEEMTQIDTCSGKIAKLEKELSDLRIENETRRKEFEIMCDRLIAEENKNKNLRTALEEAKEVVSNMTNKMDAIADSKEFIGLFQMAKIHGLEYTGDNWGNEYEKAKLWLSKWGDK